jgi:hypothetical protein
MASPSPAKVSAHRAPELEDWLNRRIYHPLAFALARLLSHTPVSPNMVSVAGVAVVIAASLAYMTLPWPSGALLGFALHLSWHVIDGADGDLARMTGKTSANGEFVDGVCDYIGHIVLYIALAAILVDQIGGWAWLLIVLAGGSHIAQNNHYESLRRTYLWWAYGVPWLRQSLADNTQSAEHSWFNFVFGWMARDYLSLSAATAPPHGEIDRLFAASADDPQATAEMRAIVRANAGGIMSWSRVLGSNVRTILLGVSMILGSPLWFLLAECVVLNGLLVASVVRGRSAERASAVAMQARLAKIGSAP